MLLDADRRALINENIKNAQQSVKKLPEIQQKTLFTRKFEALAHHKKNFQLKVETEGHAISFDQSQRNGGDESSPCPMSMLLASIAACLEMNWVVLLTLSNIEVDNVKVQVSGTLDGRYNLGGKQAPPARLETIEITTILQTDTPRAKLEHLFQKAITMCPVGGSLHEQIKKSYFLNIL